MTYSSQLEIKPFCNCFFVSETGTPIEGLPGKLMGYGARGITLNDYKNGNQCKVCFDYSPTQNLGPPTFGANDSVMSAAPEEGCMHRPKMMVSRGNYKGVIIFVDALSLKFQKGLFDTTNTLIPGALVLRKYTRHKDGWVRAGKMTSWSKQQLCTLDPGDYMFVVDQKMRVLRIEVTPLKIHTRQPTEQEMRLLYSEMTDLCSIDEF